MILTNNVSISQTIELVGESFISCPCEGTSCDEIPSVPSSCDEIPSVPFSELSSFSKVLCIKDGADCLDDDGDHVNDFPPGTLLTWDIDGGTTSGSTVCKYGFCINNTGFQNTITYSGSYASLNEMPCGGYMKINIEAETVPGEDRFHKELVIMVTRDPIDLMLVLDISGSMGTCINDSDPCESTRIDQLGIAVSSFMDRWKDFNGCNGPKDKLGAVFFNSGIVDNFTLSDFLTNEGNYVTGSNASSELHDYINNSLTAAGATAMGAGIITAWNNLVDPERNKYLILFTDGQDNRNPLVKCISSDCVGGVEFINETGYFPENGVVDPAGFAINNTKKIYSIGMYAPNFAELEEISNVTEARTNLSTQWEAFNSTTSSIEDHFQDIIGTFGSPQTIATHVNKIHNSFSAEIIPVNKDIDKLLFQINWFGDDTLKIKLEKNCLDYTNLLKMSAPTRFPYRVYSLSFPLLDSSGNEIKPEGDWMLKLYGNPGTNYQVMSIVDDHKLDYQVSMDTINYCVGDPINLTTRISYHGDPVNSANVFAVIAQPGEDAGKVFSSFNTPSSIPSNVQLEAASTRANQKYQLISNVPQFYNMIKSKERYVQLTNNGDGTYSGKFTPTEESGPYRAMFIIEGENELIGKYLRTKIASTFVSYCETSIEHSSISVSYNGKISLITFTPKNKYGNPLGPGYKQSIDVTAPSGTVVVDSVRDDLNGSYTFAVRGLKASQNPNISISVLGDEVYRVPYKKIPVKEYQLPDLLPGEKDIFVPSTKPTYKGFILSGHIGTTFPINNLGEQYKRSFIWEVDLEWKFSNRFAFEAVYGNYDFATDYSIRGTSGYLKYHQPIERVYLFLGLGGGYYDPKNRDSEYGFSSKLGIQIPLGDSDKFRLDVTGSYFNVPSPDSSEEFMGLSFGFKYILSKVKY